MDSKVDCRPAAQANLYHPAAPKYLLDIAMRRCSSNMSCGNSWEVSVRVPEGSVQEDKLYS